MKKTIYLLNIGDYAPAITKLTRPHIDAWAKKIGADIVEIKERKFPDMPVVYEKFQIYELAKANKSDWNIYIDSDALVHPDMFDPTDFLNKDTVMFHGRDMSTNRFVADNYMRRDGRFIGGCNWLAVFSDWCLDLYKPLEDLSKEEAIARIHLTNEEANSGVMEPSHLIDDFTITRNIARYGLKHMTFAQLCTAIGQNGASYFAHQYVLDQEKKVEYLAGQKVAWKIK